MDRQKIKIQPKKKINQTKRTEMSLNRGSPKRTEMSLNWGSPKRVKSTNVKGAYKNLHVGRKWPPPEYPTYEGSFPSKTEIDKTITSEINRQLLEDLAIILPNAPLTAILCKNKPSDKSSLQRTNKNNKLYIDSQFLIIKSNGKGRNVVKISKLPIKKKNSKHMASPTFGKECKTNQISRNCSPKINSLFGEIDTTYPKIELHHKMQINKLMDRRQFWDQLFIIGKYMYSSSFLPSNVDPEANFIQTDFPILNPENLKPYPKNYNYYFYFNDVIQPIQKGSDVDLQALHLLMEHLSEFNGKDFDKAFRMLVKNLICKSSWVIFDLNDLKLESFTENLMLDEWLIIKELYVELRISGFLLKEKLLKAIMQMAAKYFTKGEISKWIYGKEASYTVFFKIGLFLLRMFHLFYMEVVEETNEISGNEIFSRNLSEEESCLSFLFNPPSMRIPIRETNVDGEVAKQKDILEKYRKERKKIINYCLDLPKT